MSFIFVSTLLSARKNKKKMSFTFGRTTNTEYTNGTGNGTGNGTDDINLDEFKRYFNNIISDYKISKQQVKDLESKNINIKKENELLKSRIEELEIISDKNQVENQVLSRRNEEILKFIKSVIVDTMK